MRYFGQIESLLFFLMSLRLEGTSSWYPESTLITFGD